MSPTDYLGREIRPGDLIVYPWRRGSTMGLKKLSVQRVTPEYVSGYSNLGRPVKIVNLQIVVVVSSRETGGKASHGNASQCKASCAVPTHSKARID